MLKNIGEHLAKKRKFEIYSNEILEAEIHIEDRIILFKYYDKINHSIAVYECKFNYSSQIMEKNCLDVIQKEIANLKELERFATEYAICQDII